VCRRLRAGSFDSNRSFWAPPSGKCAEAAIALARKRLGARLDEMALCDQDGAVTRVGIAELRAHLSEYLRTVRRGRSVTILDRTTPIARIVPFESEAPLETRKATRRPSGLQQPQPGTGTTDSLAMLLLDRAGSRGSDE
jgi:prevent-host-death family protein